MADDAATWASLVIASVAAVSAALAFWANYRTIKEIQKDRKLAFVTRQLEQLYAPLLAKRKHIFDQTIENEPTPLVDILGIRPHLYLATPELRALIERVWPLECDFINDLIAIRNERRSLSSMSEPQKERRQKGIEARFQIIHQAEEDNTQLIEKVDELVGK